MNTVKGLVLALMCVCTGSVMAQNVGIGTATPLEKLHVAGTVRADLLAGVGTRIVGANATGTLVVVAPGATNQVLTQTVGGPAWQTSATNWAILGNAGTVAATNFIGTTDGIDFVTRTNNAERMRVSAGGLVGINTPSPTTRLHVNGDIRVGIVSPPNTGTLPSFGDRIHFSGGSSGPTFDSDNSDPLWMARYNAASDQTELRLNLSDNCNTPQEAFVIQAGGSACAVTDYFRFDGSGAAYKPGGGAWATLSDRRVKNNVRVYEDGLNILMAVKPVGFQYNGQGGTPDNGKEYIGVIAQDLQAIAPYMIEDSQEFLRVDPSAFTYMLINAVQTQQGQIEALQLQNAETRKVLADMQAQLAELKAAKN